MHCCAVLVMINYVAQYIVLPCECFGKEDKILLFLLLCKCNYICGTSKIDSLGLNPNVISITYVIVIKSPQD
jgi:hypothetical protein